MARPVPLTLRAIAVLITVAGKVTPTTLALLGDAPWVQRAASHVLLCRGILAKDQGDLLGAERHLREAIEQQRTIARESGTEHASACWPLLALGSVAHLRRADRRGAGLRLATFVTGSPAPAERVRENMHGVTRI